MHAEVYWCNTQVALFAVLTVTSIWKSFLKYE